jgi:regulator of telomere elongation helicase 1
MPPRKSETGDGSESIFPYRPYPQQLEFIRDVKEVVGSGGILVADACNGFGKTVCALSALLPLNSRVVYATRTHEQVRQVLEEVKRINTKAEQQYTAVNLASRQYLCLNKSCSTLSSAEGFEACRILKDLDGCQYRWNLKDIALHLSPVISIKELREIGLEKHVCPYALAKKMAETARVVVTPYQYVFDPVVRGRVNLQLDGKLLVIDEAHGIDTAALDILSEALTENALTQAQLELDSVRMPSTFIKHIQSHLRRKIAKGETKTSSGHELYGDLKRTLGTAHIATLVDSHSRAVEEIRVRSIEKGENSICYLEVVLKFLSLVESSPKDCYVTIYRRTQRGMGLIEYRCLDPRLAIKPVINKVRGTLIMSGTLAPITFFTQTIGVPDARVREYSAIAKPENVKLTIDTSVTTKFSQRNEEMTNHYGVRVAKAIASIPNGVLIFFPQRRLMMESLTKWKDKAIIASRAGTLYFGMKRMFVEGENVTENRRIVEDYKKAAEDAGAVLCCVFRGRNAEGSNFPDEQARGVILIGVPYADAGDPFINARIEYLDRARIGLGMRWYIMDAFKAANQAIGRGIRHREDWCNFLLMDWRYKTSINMLSKWVTTGGFREV